MVCQVHSLSGLEPTPGGKPDLSTKDLIREALAKAGLPKDFNPEIPILAVKIDIQKEREKK